MPQLLSPRGGYACYVFPTRAVCLDPSFHLDVWVRTGEGWRWCRPTKEQTGMSDRGAIEIHVAPAMMVSPRPPFNDLHRPCLIPITRRTPMAHVSAGMSLFSRHPVNASPPTTVSAQAHGAKTYPSTEVSWALQRQERRWSSGGSFISISRSNLPTRWRPCSFLDLLL